MDVMEISIKYISPKKKKHLIRFIVIPQKHKIWSKLWSRKKFKLHTAHQSLAIAVLTSERVQRFGFDGADGREWEKEPLQKLCDQTRKMKMHWTIIRRLTNRCRENNLQLNCVKMVKHFQCFYFNCLHIYSVYSCSILPFILTEMYANMK